MIVEYHLTNPYIEGVFLGWCSQNAWYGRVLTRLTQSECFASCDSDSNCYQAVFEQPGGAGYQYSQCWKGTKKMTKPPSHMRCRNCVDSCYAKHVIVHPVRVLEEKFVAENDVVSTMITANRTVRVEFSGQSFPKMRNTVGMNSTCSSDPATNTVLVRESGRVLANVDNRVQPNVLRNATHVLNGMSAVLFPSHMNMLCTLTSLYIGTFFIPPASKCDRFRSDPRSVWVYVCCACGAWRAHDSFMGNAR